MIPQLDIDGNLSRKIILRLPYFILRFFCFWKKNFLHKINFLKLFFSLFEEVGLIIFTQPLR